MPGTMRYVGLGLAAVLVLPAQTRVKSDNPYPFRAADLSASPRIAKLRRDIQDDRTAAVEQFWRELRQNGAPLIESIPGDDQHSLVTFVWRGSAEADNVVITDGVAVGVGGVDPMNSEMVRIPATDVWSRTYDVRNDARFTYSLSENDPLALFTDPNRKSNAKADSLNPHKFSTGQSYVELPDAPPQPWTLARPPETSGKVRSATLNSHDLGVYTPHNFQSEGASYPLVVLMGGSAYMNFVSVPATLDNLIAARRIPPVVAVAISDSMAELTCSPVYADFLANELVPWMRSTYHATNNPAQTVIGGSSLGGLASMFAAVQHPDVFGKVLSQSGSFWWKRVFGSRLVPDDTTEGVWLTRQIAAKPRLPLKFFMEVGLMEASEVQLDTNRRMRDTLIAKGYDVRYQEFNGNHNYINWRGGFGDGLVALLGK
jgi:enterochelin esterase-like enzyme